MQDFVGSVRRSLVFRPTFGEEGPGDRGGGLGGFVEKINSGIRNSRISLFSKPRVPSPKRDEAPPIRWRKGELIGCGAFGRVYMGMNIDSGELLAVKQVLVATNSASKEKTQAHVRELEDEVKLLKNLSHPNIVRYLGTVREDDSLNILLEFVPGGSISSLLGKFGSFPESVVRMYTKQLLLGLEYLHKNGIMHRDIKGANILVDNKGCIKLADFGASKKVVELATVNGAKSMKGTPYWMAPEVILQTGHNHSADIWSVGCTVIEMATGKPPWSQQYQEVAALFHIGTTKSHPPIPNHLSEEAKDFLLKCLQKEPFLRPTASELLQHPFVTGEYLETHLASQSESGNSTATPGTTHRNSINMIRRSTSRLTCTGLNDVCEVGSMKGSTLNPENLSDGTFHLPANDYDDMCRIDDKDDLCNISSVGFKSGFRSSEIIKSFNPMCERTDDSPCKFDASPEVKRGGFNLNSSEGAGISPVVSYDNSHFTFPSNQSATEEEDEVTESKIRAFLDEKALDLKRLQTPLYKEFYNTLNGVSSQSALGGENLLNFPPKSRSPKRLSSRRLSAVVDAVDSASPTKGAKPILRASSIHDQAVQDTQPPQMNQLIEINKTVNPSFVRASFLEIQRKWKEELDEELERNREKLRRAGVGGKTKSPKDPIKK